MMLRRKAEGIGLKLKYYKNSILKGKEIKLKNKFKPKSRGKRMFKIISECLTGRICVNIS